MSHLGLDIGTTSIAVVAVGRDGNVLHTAGRPHGADVAGLPEGHAEQDPARLQAVAVELLRETTATLDTPPVSLGVTGQMHGVVLLDEHRRPISNLVTWQDRRANGPFDPADPSGPSHLERLLDLADPEALERTGTRPAPGFLGVTLAVLAARRELPPEAHRAVCAADWFVAEATGAEPATAPSHAASTGLFDVDSGEWSDALVRSAGLRADLLPECLAADAVVGHVTYEFAAETGLPRDLPVCNAVGDHQASILGSVPAGEPALHVNLGTGGQIDWPVEEFVRVAGMDTRPLPIGRRMLVGAGLAGGDAFAWVRRTAERWMRELGASVDADTVYDRLLELAESATTGSLRATPTFRGTRTDPTATGTLERITNDNFGLGDLARAVLVGIVRGFAEFVDRAGPLAPNATRVIGTGNGLERNPLLARLLGERFGLPVVRPAHAEAAAYGAALLGGTAVGAWSSLEDAARGMRWV